MLFKQSLLIVAAFSTAVAYSLPEGINITWYGDLTPAERSFDSTVDLRVVVVRTCSDKYVYISPLNTTTIYESNTNNESFNSEWTER